MTPHRTMRETSAASRVARLPRSGARAGRTAFCASIILASAVLLAGCTAAPAPATGSASSTPAETLSPSPRPSESLGEPGAPGCAPASPQAVDETTGFTEVQGTADDGDSLYGLAMADVPLTAGEWVDKFVWRITGDGDLGVTVTGPDGSPSTLDWGPEVHGGSSYQRPGEEWGTGIIFDTPGCWQLDFVRGSTTASVYLNIAP